MLPLLVHHAQYYDPAVISSNFSILFPTSFSFASSTSCTTSRSMPGKICINVAWFASAARCVARSICACTPAMSSPGVGVRDTEYGGVRGGGVRGGVPPRNCVACERKDGAEFED
ncbi:hypothetical protein K523DRAFT_324486 [Schizophyllum commune Tattone D]|nr:hypothetical protein K523DRAFT_324486 [Schizophyllum commune Tattone D]